MPLVQASPVIQSRGLVQGYGPKTVLHGLDLDVDAGAIGLLGPNGSGKSTLLRTLLGLIQPRSGTAQVLGLDIAKDPVAVRRRVGLVPESECMVPGMNAVEITSYVGELVGMSHRDAVERAHQVLYYVGLGEARYRDLGSYSQGMKQRLKLAQALVHDPDLLFLDEPTSGMDPPGREAMLDLIRDISEHKGISVVLSTHLLADVEETCDFVVVLKDGRLADYRRVERKVLDRGLIYDLRGRGEFAALRAHFDASGHHTVEIQDGIRVHLSGQEGTQAIFEALRSLEGRVEIRHMLETSHGLKESFLETAG